MLESYQKYYKNAIAAIEIGDLSPKLNPYEPDLKK